MANNTSMFVLSMTLLTMILFAGLKVSPAGQASLKSALVSTPMPHLVETSKNASADKMDAEGSEISAESPIIDSTADESTTRTSTIQTETADETMLEKREIETETSHTASEYTTADTATESRRGLPEVEKSTTLTSEASRRPPHIVFVLADDYGHSDIGYHGSWIETPVMDRLAAEGVKLENYYVQPICSPTRSQLLSGRYQIRTGLQHDIIEPCQPTGLPLDSPTLADKLKESGYSTHMVGKWHLGYYKREYLPHNRGFDTFYGMLLGSGNHYSHKHRHKRKAYLDLHSNDQPVRNETGSYSTHLFTQKAIDIVRAHDRSKPLFLYLSYQAVHGPIQVPKPYTEPYKHIKDSKRKTYAGMVTAMDEGVGNLTSALKDAGMWDNTVLVFSSDNGGRVKQGSSNYPLRGEKHTLWEGGVKAIGFVSGGGLKRQGAVTKELMHVSDWFPTFVKLAGGRLNGTKPLDGVDQWSAINKGTAGSRHTLLHNIDIMHHRRGWPTFPGTFDTSVRAAIRVGDLKLITGDPDISDWLPPPESGLSRQRGWDNDGGKNVWLFNITADPNEHKDLSKSRPKEVVRMLDLLQKYRDSEVKPFYPRSDRRCNPRRRGGVWGPWM